MFYMYFPTGWLISFIYFIKPKITIFKFHLLLDFYKFPNGS